MTISTMNDIPGKQIKETLGLVRGNTIQTRWVGSDVWAGLKTLAGGELKNYTRMISQARDEALERMKKEAEELGADAVVGVRFTTSSVMTGAAEILAYGTAVKVGK